MVFWPSGFLEAWGAKAKKPHFLALVPQASKTHLAKCRDPFDSGRAAAGANVGPKLSNGVSLVAPGVGRGPAGAQTRAPLREDPQT